MAQPATSPLESLLTDARDSVSNTLTHWGDVGSGMLTSIGNKWAYGNDNGASTSPGEELGATAATSVLGDLAARGTRIGRQILSPLTGESRDQIEAAGNEARNALTYQPRLPQTAQFLQDVAPYAKGAAKFAGAITPDWVKNTGAALKAKWQDAAKDVPLATDVLGTAAMYNPESVLGLAGDAASAAGKGAGWVAKNAEHFPYDLGFNPKMHIVAPGEGAPMAPAGLEHSFHNDIQPIADDINANGGITYHPGSGKRPAEGYAVSPFKDAERLIPGQVDYKDIGQYLIDNKHRFQQDPQMHLGAWFNPGDANTYLDVSKVHPDIDSALQTAKDHNQIGIYDLKRGATIYTDYPQGVVDAIKANPEMSTTAQFMHDHLTPEEFQRLGHDGFLDEAHKMMQQTKNGEITSPEQIAAMAHAGLAKVHWYQNSANALTHIFGEDSPRFGALLAAMSPQTSVESNLRNALNTWKNWVQAGRPQEPHAILDIMGRSVEGNKGLDSVLPAWRNNGIDALTHPAPEHLQLSGPKVDSFAANLRGDLNPVTNDAWQATGSRVPQEVFGGHGLREFDRLRETGKTLKSGAPQTTPVGGMGPGYLYQNAMTRRAGNILTDETGVNWAPANVQEAMWSYVKPLVEMRREGMASGADLHQLHALLDEKDIAGTPDFSSLLRDTPEYAGILRNAGYSDKLDTLHTVPHLDTPVTKQSYAGETYRPDDLMAALNAIQPNINAPIAKLPTEMPAFERWNNATGIPAASPKYRRPIPVVHATGADFTTPDMGKTDWAMHVGPPSASNARVEDPAAYSSSYAPNSQPLYINTKNPARMTDSNGAWMTDRMANDLVKRGTITPEEAQYVQAPYDQSNGHPVEVQERDARQRLIDLLKQKGYDAIVYQNRYEGPTDAQWAKVLASKGLDTRQAQFADMTRLKQEIRRSMSDEEFKAAFPDAEDSYLVWDPGMIKGRFNRGTWDPKDPNRMKAKGGLIRKYADGGPVMGQLPDVTVTAQRGPASNYVPAPMDGPPVAPDPKYGTKTVMLFGRPVTVSADPMVEARARAAMQRLTQQDLVDAIRRQKGQSIPASKYGSMTARRASPAWLQQDPGGTP